MTKLMPYLVYSFVGGGVMLVAMLLGEYFHGPIFYGFSQKPHLWFLCFLETIVWVVPLTGLAAFIFSRFPGVTGVRLIALSMGFWISLSTCVFLIYQLYSDSRLPPWSEANITLPYVFGWYIPGVITIALFSLLSPIVFSKSQTVSLSS